MEDVSIKKLISQGQTIQSGLKYVKPAPNVVRLYQVYSLSNVNEYYQWKECAIRFLHLYYPSDLERFIKYSDEFEEHHYLPQFIANMIGVLVACDSLPSEKMKEIETDVSRFAEIEKVKELEEAYLAYKKAGSARVNRPEAKNAFLVWHAAACVLFDKWFYSNDSDLIKFQAINASDNGNTCSRYYDEIYSPYCKLMSRLEEGRELKRSSLRVGVKKIGPATNGVCKKVNIFISYSHSDEKWLERLKQHLKVLLRYSDNVDYWDDTKLKGGDKWKKEIADAIERANVAILLVSTDFLASDFISTDELPPLLVKAEETGTRILPIIVSPCAYEMSELEVFQALNKPEETLEDMLPDFAAVERVFLSLVKEIQDLARE